MQEKRFDGSYGEPVPFDQTLMIKKLNDPEVRHVEVFSNTPEEMERRRKLYLGIKPVNKKAKKKRNRMQRKSRKNSR